MTKQRQAEIQRTTRETEVLLRLELDGSGKNQIDSGVPFLDHMLTLFSVHSLCDLTVAARGDIEVDDHHTVEDIGICLGQAIAQALADRSGIQRYGEATVPMDEALARVVIDVSGRPYLSYQAVIPAERLGSFSAENVQEFFRAVVNHAGITMHIDLIRGENSHHIVEAIFKAFGRAFYRAVSRESTFEGVWSSKGIL